MNTTSRPSPPSKPLDLEITIVSAKHLKNVNWRQGDLKPYVTFRLESEIRSTKHDDSGSTRPVWNERFVVPIATPLHDAVLHLEVLHSGRIDSNKTLVGSFRLPLADFVGLIDPTPRLHTYDLRRPSGRPHGRIRLKLAVAERPSPPEPSYQFTPPHSSYYSSAPPPPPPANHYGGYFPSLYTTPPPQQQPQPPSQLPKMVYPSGGYSDSYPGYSYPGYGSGYYQQQLPPPPPRPFLDRNVSYGLPSAPVDYTPYDQRPKGRNLGPGMAVGGLAGAMGGLALDEGLKFEDDRVHERFEDDRVHGRDSDSDYHPY